MAYTPISYPEQSEYKVGTDLKGALEQYGRYLSRKKKPYSRKAWADYLKSLLSSKYSSAYEAMREYNKLKAQIDQFNKSYELNWSKYETEKSQWESEMAFAWEKFEEAKSQWQAEYDEKKRQFDKEYELSEKSYETTKEYLEKSYGLNKWATNLGIVTAGVSVASATGLTSWIGEKLGLKEAVKTMTPEAVKKIVQETVQTMLGSNIPSSTVNSMTGSILGETATGLGTGLGETALGYEALGTTAEAMAAQKALGIVGSEALGTTAEAAAATEALGLGTEAATGLGSTLLSYSWVPAVGYLGYEVGKSVWEGITGQTEKKAEAERNTILDSLKDELGLGSREEVKSYFTDLYKSGELTKEENKNLLDYARKYGFLVDDWEYYEIEKDYGDPSMGTYTTYARKYPTSGGEYQYEYPTYDGVFGNYFSRFGLSDVPYGKGSTFGFSNNRLTWSSPSSTSTSSKALSDSSSYDISSKISDLLGSLGYSGYGSFDYSSGSTSYTPGSSYESALGKSSGSILGAGDLVGGLGSGGSLEDILGWRV